MATAGRLSLAFSVISSPRRKKPQATASLSLSRLCFTKMCLFFFLFYRLFRLLHLTNTYTHTRPIIGPHQEKESEHARCVGRERERERARARSSKFHSLPLALLRSSFVCRKKSKENFDSSIHTYTSNQSKCPRRSIVIVRWCKTRRKRRRRESSDLLPMAHLTIVTKRYWRCVSRPRTSLWDYWCEVFPREQDLRLVPFLRHSLSLPFTSFSSSFMTCQCFRREREKWLR